jgi:hypothetical protein
MTAFINHFSFELRAGIRDKQLLLVNYLLPLGFYFMMAFIMPGINPMFLEFLIPAMVTFAILSATLLGIPDPLVKAREDGIYRSYKINGVPASSILTIPALTTVLHLVIVAAIITVTAHGFRFCWYECVDWRALVQHTHDGDVVAAHLSPLYVGGGVDASIQLIARYGFEILSALAGNACNERLQRFSDG